MPDKDFSRGCLAVESSRISLTHLCLGLLHLVSFREHRCPFKGTRPHKACGRGMDFDREEKKGLFWNPGSAPLSSSRF